MSNGLTKKANEHRIYFEILKKGPQSGSGGDPLESSEHVLPVQFQIEIFQVLNKSVVQNFSFSEYEEAVVYQDWYRQA